jgi:hypothetical protein
MLFPVESIYLYNAQAHYPQSFTSSRGVRDIVLDEGRPLVVSFVDETQRRLAMDIDMNKILQSMADACESRDYPLRSYNALICCIKMQF